MVTMELGGGASMVLVMHDHSHYEGRTMRYDGTRATLRGRFDYGTGRLEIHDHLTGRCEEIPIETAASGHGGGDFGVVRSFVRALQCMSGEPSQGEPPRQFAALEHVTQSIEQ